MEKDIERTRLIDYFKFNTYERTFKGMDVVKCEVGTTGCCEGDCGHGGRTYLRLTSFGHTDMRVGTGYDSPERTDTVRMVFGGDDELKMLVQVLEFVCNTLKKQINENKYEFYNNISYGDWLEVWGYETKNRYNVKVVKVWKKHIDRNGKTYDVLDFKDEFGKLGSRPLEDSAPIPLTKDILLKNGFMRKEGVEVYAFPTEWNEPLSEIVFKDNGEYLLRLCRITCDWVEINGRYVHELQHALRLVGACQQANDLKI